MNHEIPPSPEDDPILALEEQAFTLIPTLAVSRSAIGRGLGYLYSQQSGDSGLVATIGDRLHDQPYQQLLFYIDAANNCDDPAVKEDAIAVATRMAEECPDYPKYQEAGHWIIVEALRGLGQLDQALQFTIETTQLYLGQRLYCLRELGKLYCSLASSENSDELKKAEYIANALGSLAPLEPDAEMLLETIARRKIDLKNGSGPVNLFRLKEKPDIKTLAHSHEINHSSTLVRMQPYCFHYRDCDVQIIKTTIEAMGIDWTAYEGSIIDKVSEQFPEEQRYYISNLVARAFLVRGDYLTALRVVQEDPSISEVGRTLTGILKFTQGYRHYFGLKSLVLQGSVEESFS